MPDTLSSQILDPAEFQQFSAEKAIVVRAHKDEDISVVVWNLEPGQSNALHVHRANAHSIMVLEGSGQLLTDGPPRPIRAGQCVVVPRGVVHGVHNDGPGRLSYLAVTNEGAAGYVKEQI